MIFYLTLCFLGMFFFGAIIGWRRVIHWESIAGFYFLCFFITFFLRPLYIFATGYDKQFYNLGLKPIQGWWTVDWLIIKLGLAIIVGLTSFAILYRHIVSSIHEDQSFSAVFLTSQVLPVLLQRLKIVSIIFIVLALLCIFIYRPLPGLRDESEVTMVLLSDTGYGFVGTTGYIALAERFIIPACVLFFLTTGNMPLTVVLASPFIALRLWFGWGRQSLVHLAFSLVLAALTTTFWTRDSGKKTILLAALVMAIAVGSFGVLGQDRQAFQKYYYQGRGPMMKYQEATEEGYLSSLVGFEISLHWLKNTPKVFPYIWGENYLYAFFILPIPRILWPEKRNIFASEKYTGKTDYLHGATPGCIGDAWQNGGWLGLVVLFALAGTVCGFAQRARNWRKCPLTGLLIYLTVYPLAISLVRSGPYSLAIQLYFIGLPALISYLVERHFSLQPGREPNLPGISRGTALTVKGRESKGKPDLLVKRDS